ncbi:MAG: amidohydrolase family protein [Candidatus Muiribacteriota bacterium]
MQKYLFFITLGVLLLLLISEPLYLKHFHIPVFDVSVLDGELVIFTGTVADSFKIIDNGAVVVSGNDIVWVGENSQLVKSKGVVVNTDEYIYPGFVETHNHPDYNFLGEWRIGRTFSNRYEWSRTKEYKELTANRSRMFRENRDTRIMVMRYAEAKAMIGGANMIQGAPRLRGIADLVRNMDSYNMIKEDTIRTSIFPLQPREITRAETVIEAMADRRASHFVIHLGEGIDEGSKQEFYDFEKTGLLRKETLIIHGTGFGKEEFDIMAEKEMNLIWSPKSNYICYGTSTRADIAHQSGVTIALAPDWSLTGSDNMLEEIQFAEEVNKELFGSYFSHKDLFDMITINAANITGFGDYLGSIDKGKKADFVFTQKKHSNPYSSLLENDLSDIMLVVIDGIALYGQPERISILSGNYVSDKLTVNGVEKSIIVKTDLDDVPLSDMTLREIVDTIAQYYPEVAPLATDVILH